jgi:hypothetical protein
MALRAEKNMIDGQTFQLLSDPELPESLTDATLTRCTFVACTFGTTARAPSDRRNIRSVVLRNCKAMSNCSLGPAILESVEISDLSTQGLCIAWGAVYKHVRFRGSCGRFMSSFLPTPVHSAQKVALFERANRSYYERVDWAIDISRAEFEEIDIRNVPARLIRRDPETQVVVRRDKIEATRNTWQNLDLAGTPWANSLANVLRWGLEDKVLVAPKRSRDFAKWLSGLKLLQRAGVAEPD